MSDNKFGFTVDDIIAEFDKKKSEPAAPQNSIQNDDFSEEFSEELSPTGEYVPRHMKPAPPEKDITANAEQTAEEASEHALPEEDTAANAEQTPVETSENALPEEENEEPQTQTDDAVPNELLSEYSEENASLDTSTSPESTEPSETTETAAETNETAQNSDSVPDESTEIDITYSNISSDNSEEETYEAQEPEQETAPQAVLNGVVPVTDFSDGSAAENNSFRSVFENGLDVSAAETETEQETIQILAANIPDWNNLVPEIQEQTPDTPEPEGEEIEEEEAEPSESSDDTAELPDDEVIEDDDPETDKAENTSDINASETDTEASEEENSPTDDIPPFDPEPLSPDVLNADNTPEKEKKNILKEILPWKGDSIFEIIRKIVFIIAVIVFVGAGIMLASTLIQSNRAVKDLEEIKGVVTTTAKTTIDSDGNVVTIAPTEEEEQQHNIDIMSYYKGISDKVVGFIELDGCDLYQPVVQDPSDTENTYYLTHTYYDEPNKGGAIFMDFRCTISEDYVSPNIVLYGHNQEDGTMFGNLKNYKQNLDFYAENPVVTLRTEYETGTYLIYAYFVTNALEKQDSNGVVFHYHDYIEALNDEATFDWYMGEVQSRNQIISPVKAEFGDKLLVLSTCSNEFSNSRFVVFARKLRDGESVSDYDFTTASFNPYARGVDWTAIMSGETTTTEETTAPEEDEEESETTLKRLKKKQTSASDDENTDETTTVPEESDDDGSDETSSSKKKTTTAEDSEEETTTKKTTKKTTAEEETTTKKTTKKTTAESETSAEETSSDSEDSAVTSVPENGEEEVTTVTAGSSN
ncbi:MAG: sortase domain-bontaining protein [Oscillospiraceae bacterium]